MSSHYRPRGSRYEYDDGYPRPDHRRVPSNSEIPSTPPAPYYPPPQSAVRYRSTETDNRYRVHDVESANRTAEATETTSKPKFSHPVPIFRLVFDLILLLLAWVPVILLNSIAKPYQRGFYCDDESIRYPLYNDSITPLALYTVGAAIVLVTVFITECVISFTRQQNRQTLYSVRGKLIHPLLSSIYIYLGYCVTGFLMVQITTDICKNMVGRLRPHFIEACNPDWSRINCSGYRYVIQPFCQNTDEKVLTDARVSFLSGHSSYAAYMMFYLVLYLQARWHWPGCSLLAKYFLQFAFAMLALFTGLSRISDYRHHWSDVLSGFALGILGACLIALHIGKFFKREARARIENETGRASDSGIGYPYFGARYNPNDGKAVY